MEKQGTPIFTDEQVASIVEYGNALRGIRVRLAAEGYFLGDGRSWNIFKCAVPFEVEWDD